MPSTYHPPSFTKHLEVTQPNTIYHYANQAGFLGVITNRELWATKIHYMNDSTEFAFVFRMVEEILEGEKDPPALSQTKFLSNLMRDFANASKDVNVCVVCFCTGYDLLSQWRGYAGGTSGYSIGFNTRKLKNVAESNGFFLGRCIYDKSVQRLIVEEICNYFLQSTNANTMAIIQQFTSSVIECGAFFKDSAFSAEDEWRLVSAPISASKLYYRPGKSMIIPYSKIEIPGVSLNSPIEDVTIGPCPHMKLSGDAVRSFLFKEQIGRPTTSPPPGVVVPVVRESVIPYRDW